MRKDQSMTLWEAIDQLARQIPFTREKVEAVLSVTLTRWRQSPATDSYQSDPLALADGVVIDDVDLRVSRAGDRPGFLVLPVSGTCISLAQIKARYPQVYFDEPAYTQSPNEEKFYSIRQPWGKLNFGFRQGAPNCLASLSLDPRKAKS